MKKRFIKIAGIMLSLMLILSSTPTYAVTISRSNSADTAIEMSKPPSAVNYFMARGQDRHGKFIVDSEKWFKFKPSSAAYYEFRASTNNTNRRLSLMVYSSDGTGKCTYEPLFTDISNVGKNCMVSICSMLAANKYYYIEVISTIADYGKEPKTSNVVHTFYTAQHNHNLSYKETSDGNGITESCQSASCIYKKTYPKIASAYCTTTDYLYDGKAKQPSVVVKDKSGAVVNKKYYVVTYGKDRTNVGTYPVSIKFVQPYAKYLGNDGKTIKTTANLNPTFRVLPKIEKISVSPYTTNYNGKVVTPNVKFTDSKGNKVPSSFYTLTYPSGRRNVGLYVIKATFKAPYNTSRTIQFYVQPQQTAVSSVSAGTKSFTVKWKKIATQNSGYRIQYSTDKSFKTGVKTIKVGSYNTTSYTVKKLSAKKRYYVRVCTVKRVNKKDICSTYSAGKGVTTK